MTLTRTPCELDKMSLFQDLKLKRRKVDSRCSSDGESVADTSTSSPDLVSPPSPKMSEGTVNPPSPDSTPGRVNVLHLKLEEPGVFDGGGGQGKLKRVIGGTSVIRALPTSRSQSPPPVLRPPPTASPSLPPRPHSSPGRPANASPVIRHSSPLATSPPVCSPLRLPPPTSPLAQITSPPSRSVVSPQTATVIQNQLWFQNSRINGVKPELIGGNFTGSMLLSHEMKSPTATTSLRSPGPVRQTPTVIMGEAGGVRTMIWSQPANIDPQLLPTTSAWAGSIATTLASGTNPEENAAQMLLNLGQERSRVAQSRTSLTRVLKSPTSTTASTTLPLSSHFTSVPLNMERLWAGDLTQLPANQQMQALNLSSPTMTQASVIYANPRTDIRLTGVLATTSTTPQETQEEEEQPMICMICEDKATGLHYGIITCEGCKGFFKRTVQNRRVYTCVADGNCEITKAQRNRCQYCRFKKCIEQGMVLQAVREDRMPGGRNSGAVYNLYKVKYKKHKKAATKHSTSTVSSNAAIGPSTSAAAIRADRPTTSTVSPQMRPEQQPQPGSGVPAHLVNGTILKTALTNPSEVVHLRQRLDSAAVTSSRDRNYSIEYTLSMLQALIDCDEFEDIATLQNTDDLYDYVVDVNDKLCQIGDSIVYKLVEWTKRLPFYLELPVQVHTMLLTQKWHELLVLTTSAYQAIHGSNPREQTPPVAKEEMSETTTTDADDFHQEVNANLQVLQNCLMSMTGRPITIEHLRGDVGLMVEKITHVTLMFRQMKLAKEEYVCLKVIIMLNQVIPDVSTDLENIQERYMTCLKAYTQHMFPQQPTRFQDLLNRLPEIASAAALLLESKMFYVPFLLNSTVQR